MKRVMVCCIFDSASGEYGVPFFAVNDDVARRQACITLNSLPINYWKDFQVVQIGLYDTECPTLIPFEYPEDFKIIADGLDLINVFENMYKEVK